MSITRRDIDRLAAATYGVDISKKSKDWASEAPDKEIKYVKANVQGLPDKKRPIFEVLDEGARPARVGVWVEVYKIKDVDGKRLWVTDYTGEEELLSVGWAKVTPQEKETEAIGAAKGTSGLRIVKSKKPKGWRYESSRHSLARKGIKTGTRKR